MRPDQLNSTFAALADPTRRAILAHLMSGDATVTELAEPFEMSMAAISKHLKVLQRAGLTARGRAAQWRSCRIHPAPLKDVADWVEHCRMAFASATARDFAVQQHGAIEGAKQTLDRLAEHLAG